MSLSVFMPVLSIANEIYTELSEHHRYSEFILSLSVHRQVGLRFLYEKFSGNIMDIQSINN